MTAIVIAVLGALANWLWNLAGYSPAGRMSGAIIQLFVSAQVTESLERSDLSHRRRGHHRVVDTVPPSWAT